MNIHHVIIKPNGSSLCPVASYRKYVSKLSPKMEHLWQRPRDAYSPGDPVWYCSMRLGEKTLGAMMARMSKQYHLSKRYTNHCLCSTSISILDASVIEGRQIIQISGHKNESSIKSYSRNLTSAKKRAISSTISKAMGAENQENQEPEIVHELNFEEHIPDDMLWSIPDIPEVNPLSNDFLLLNDQHSVNSGVGVSKSPLNSKGSNVSELVVKSPVNKSSKNMVISSSKSNDTAISNGEMISVDDKGQNVETNVVLEIPIH